VAAEFDSKHLVERASLLLRFWLLALLIGICGGAAAVGFRLGVETLQSTFYGNPDLTVIESFVRALGWYWIIGIPTLGGLAVGILMQVFTRDGRVRSVADVIEGAAIRDGRIEHKEGVVSAIASLITLSSGGSSGREGPVVHIAALISSWIVTRARLDGVTGRDLMGCAVAAAVSASFNTPIAGAIFAQEVVMRHFAIRSFAPIVIASVAGTVVNRLRFGDVTEFSLPQTNALDFYIELPAFAMLGIVSGIVATLLMMAVYHADSWGNRVQFGLRLPIWIRPMIAGALLGHLAMIYPHIIGVGYETTSKALTGELPAWEALNFAIFKAVAVTITLAGRMGGGIFSPSLMLGALTGLTFGHVAVATFPAFTSGGETLYALAGMGAVAASVLGSPLSTILIIFEMTGDWQAGLAVMLAVSTSTAVSASLNHKSFFLTQLMRRNIQIAAGPQAYLLQMYTVRSVMCDMEDCRHLDQNLLWEKVKNGYALRPGSTLAEAMPILDRFQTDWVPVISASEGETPDIVGVLFQVDALKAYNRALAATAREEHS
jgi:CIC family chloride channel protein